MSRGTRDYVFTVNNPTDGDFAQLELLKKKSKYGTYGDEVGDEGTRHLQGYVSFSDAKTLTAASKCLSRARLEVRGACSKLAMLYCQKGEQTHAEWDEFKEKGPNFGKNVKMVEWGIRPKTDGEKGEGEKCRWAEALLAVQEMRYDAIPADIGCRNLKSIEYFAKRLRETVVKVDDLTSFEHIWYYGETGTGKSYAAKTHGTFYPKSPTDKWWDGYNGEEIVVIEDFDVRQAWLVGHIKRWADESAFQADSKNEALRKIRPRMIIVTSNYHPRDIWTADADVLPILDRFEVVHLTEKHERKRAKRVISPAPI